MVRESFVPVLGTPIVKSMLRSMGLSQERNFQTHHRVTSSRGRVQPGNNPGVVSALDAHIFPEGSLVHGANPAVLDLMDATSTQWS